MSETRQFNVRVPDEARGALTRIATKLREDAGFIGRLEAWLDTLDDPTADDSLAERVARIEARLDAMGDDQLSTRVDDVQGTPTDTPQGTPWTTGEGRGRRLTTAGERDLELRIQAGQPDADIANAMGISLNTIRTRRKKIDERLL